jgi:hypothetical protein
MTGPVAFPPVDAAVVAVVDAVVDATGATVVDAAAVLAGAATVVVTAAVVVDVAAVVAFVEDELLPHDAPISANAAAVTENRNRPGLSMRTPLGCDLHGSCPLRAPGTMRSIGTYCG